MAKHGKNGIQNAYEVFKKENKERLSKATTEKNIITTDTNNSVADILTEDVNKKAAEICAQNLKEVFEELKQKYPLKKQLNLFATFEPDQKTECKGRSFIKTFLEEVDFDSINSSDQMTVLGYLGDEMDKLGLKISRPSYSYFRALGPFDNPYYNVSFKDADTIREQEISNRGSEAAESLKILFDKFESENPDDSHFMLRPGTKDWKIILELLKDVDYEDIGTMLDSLSKEMIKYGLTLSMPATSYFEQNSNNKYSAYLKIMHI